MRTLVLTLAVFGAVFMTTAAFATPSTLIWIPSVDIQPAGTWHLGIDNYFTSTDGYRSPTDVGLTYGLAKGRAELGIDYMGGSDDPLYLNGKYLLMAETAKAPALAVGLFNFGFKDGVTDYNMAYLLGAKTFEKVRVTLGYCHGKEATLGVDPDMFLAGLDGYLTADKKWWGAVDYQSGDNGFGALSFGASYAFSDNASVLIGYDMYNADGADDTITTQVDINF
jgi:hypothetical protein